MDKDLLFGVIAVQLGQATPQQVMAAASACVVDRSKSIPDRLLEGGVFTPERFAMLSSMVDEALKAHGGDAKKTMHTLGGERAVYASFGGSLAIDEEGRLSLAPKEKSVGGSGKDLLAVTPETAGRYRFDAQAEIGRGGIGRVMVAVDEHLGREIAVKELLGEAGGSQVSTPRTDAVSRTSAAVARFLREARVTGQLEHPNIVPVYEVGRRGDGTFYYTMKLVRGRTMAKALAECASLGDRLKLLHHYVDLCNAVAYAHSRGVVHRDIKTENVMLGEFGETVVLDWGLAKVQGKKDIRGNEIARELAVLHDAKTGHTVDGSAIGTPAYMSPEQADGKVEEIDARSDVWSLGAVLYEILTGRPPFEGYTPYEIIGKVLKDEVVAPKVVNAEVPAELSAVAMKALTRDKARRYQKAGDLSAEVQAFMTGGRISAYEYSSWELLKGFAAKHKAASALVAIIFALVVASSVVLYRAYGKAEAERRRAEESRLLAELNLAAAFQAKADQLFEDKRILSSRIYSAAALVEHPCNRLGIEDPRECDRRFPGGADIRMRARSNLYQAGLDVIALPDWIERGSSNLQDLDVSADRSSLLISTKDGKVQVWDGRKRRLKSTVSGSKGAPRTGVALSPDGRVIAAWEEGESVALRDAAGKAMGSLPQKVGPGRRHLMFDQATGQLLVMGGSGVVTFWDVKTRAVAKTIDTGSVVGRTWQISPDGAWLLKVGETATELWDVARLKLAWAAGGVTVPRGAAFSPDESVIAVGSDLRTIEILDSRTGARLRSIVGHQEGVSDVEFSPNGRYIVSASTDKTLKFWDARTFELRYVLEDPTATFTGIEFLSDGRTLVSTDQEGGLRAWSVNDGTSKPSLEGVNRIWDVEFSPDGALLAFAGGGGIARVCDAQSFETRWEAGGVGEHTSIRFSADGALLAMSRNSSGMGIEIALWDVAKAARLRAAPSPGAFGAVLSPDGKRVANALSGGKTELWDAATFESPRVVDADSAGQYYAAFSPDSRVLATAGADEIVRLWDVETGELRGKLEGHDDSAYCFAFTADGKRLLVGGLAGSVVLWDLPAGRKIREFVGHGRWVNSVSFAPGEKIFVSASDEGTVRIWDVASGENLLTIRTSSEAYDAAVSPDGRTIAVTDGPRIRLRPFDLTVLATDPKKLLAQAQEEAGMRLDGFALVPLETK